METYELEERCDAPLERSIPRSTAKRFRSTVIIGCCAGWLGGGETKRSWRTADQAGVTAVFQLPYWFVRKETLPLYHEMIRAFGERAGVPAVLNTSFNVKGEPVVCTPRDAIRNFYSCGLDVLYLGPFRIEKRPPA